MQLEEIISFDNVKDAFFYIPDISGFTRFINHSNICTSKHIIKTLLESIIDSNILNLKIAEIQGDAVVFYSLGTPPSITKLEAQVRRTFHDFQKKLCILNSQISSADLQDLSLKMIVHYGKVSTTTIKGVPKLLGSDIILAHQMLKNNIHEDEYLLITNNYLHSQNPSSIFKSFKWSEWKEGKKNYEHFGPVSYHYTLLSTLKEQVCEPEWWWRS